MPHAVQFILDKNSQPTHAILEIDTYHRLIEQGKSDLPSIPSLISEDGLYIRLPYGGSDAHIDLVRLVDYCVRESLISIAINARQQSLDKFPDNQMGSLDPMLRMCFLPKDSPYRNTMQATKDVVDALVETGLFVRAKRTFDHYYRPVNALDLVEDKARIFYEKYGPAKDPIPYCFWKRSELTNRI